MIPKVAPIIAALLLLSALPSTAQSRPGIAGRSAPDWEGLEWLNLPAGRTSLEVEDFRGKVLYVFCFQSWCPGCHSHGFPTLQAVEEHFRDHPDIYFVAVQTVFEGAGTNTPLRGLDEVESYDLEIPVAHAEGEDGPPAFMRAYRTGGTPWTIIVDPGGKVRFDGFGITPKKAIALIEGLLPAAAAPSPAGSMR